MADDILRQGVVGISDIIVKAGMINVDFADVQSVMGASGLALMGIGTADGKNHSGWNGPSTLSGDRAPHLPPWAI